MCTQIIEYFLVARKLTPLCDRNASSPALRQLVDELVTLLAYEATHDVAVRETDVVIPIVPAKGPSLTYPRLIPAPILHADLGMLEGVSKLLPTVGIGLPGMKRDETTFEAYMYADRLPNDLSGRQCHVVGPMLVTSHTLIDAVNYLLERGTRDVTCVCLLAVPGGLWNLEGAVGGRTDVTIVLAALDERLNENGYTVPGLGDTDGRLCSVVD